MENIEYIIQVMVIGFSGVMAILFVLYGILIIFSRIFNHKEKNNTLEIPDQRLIAAITAAVYQYLLTNNNYIVPGDVSIAVQPSRNTGSSRWQLMGRKMLLDSKLELTNIRRKKHHESI